MNPEHEASRTLVKSPPELWTECSDAGALARHIGEFGDIRITKLEPQTSVAWEGDRASGTVRLEPSGWGTKVILTAQLAAPVAPEPVASVVPEPVRPEPVRPEPVMPEPIAPPPAPPQRSRGFFGKLLGLFRPAPAPVAPPSPPRAAAPEPLKLAPRVEPVPAAVPDPDRPGQPDEPDEPELDPPELDPAAILTAALDSLGQAHHRPFSRG